MVLMLNDFAQHEDEVATRHGGHWYTVISHVDITRSPDD